MSDDLINRLTPAQRKFWEVENMSQRVLNTVQFYRAAPAYRDEPKNGSPSGEGESGPGVYLTNSHENAQQYMPTHSPGEILSVTADVRNPLVRHVDVPDDPGEKEYRSMRETVGYGKPDKWHAELAARGYDAVEKHEVGGKHPYEIAVHPSKIRSTKAVT